MKIRLKKRLLTSAFAIMLMQVNLAWATEWEKILDREKDSIHVDLDSFATTDNHPSILIKRIPKPATHTAVNASAKSAVQIERFQFDCNQHLIRKIPQDSQLTDSRKNSLMQFRPIADKTVEQEIERLVCQVNKMVGGL